MKALYVAAQDSASRAWAPVGRLTREGGLYRFVYTRGALTLPNFVPFGRMSDVNREYVSTKLFPLFNNRVLPRSRPEYRDYLRWLGLSPEEHDALEELARTGGVRATDSLELIPSQEPSASGTYDAYFLSRGLRHLPAESRSRAEALVPGERLYLMPDIQNPHDALALMIRTGDPLTILGYCPKYYARDFNDLLRSVDAERVEVTVERVNLDAPLQYRVLCKLSAPWPAGFSPFCGNEYQPIAEPKVAAEAL